MWAVGIRQYKIQLPWGFILKISAFSAVASCAAYAVIARMAPLPALIVGGMIVLGVFFLLAYIFKVLEQEDSDRFKIIANACPPAVAAPINFLLDRFTRGMISNSTIV